MMNNNNSHGHYNHTEHRDPHNNNEYIQVKWSDIINEPTGAHSTDLSWNLSYKIYTKSQSCCYKSLAFILGPILALWFGLRFGCQSFMHIWCYQPCLRHLKIDLTLIRQMNILIVEATCVPLVKACSYFFSNVNVRYENLPSGLPPTHRQERVIQIEPSEKLYDDVSGVHVQ